MRSLIADAFGLVVIDNMPSRARIVLPNSLLVAGFAILLLQAWAMRGFVATGACSTRAWMPGSRRLRSHP